jgi:hypothetical protein
LADGRVVRRKAYEVEVEFPDDKGKVRRVKTEATIENREYKFGVGRHEKT